MCIRDRSIGMLPSASLNSSSQGMYEPCHGSAPDIAHLNVANPIAMILSLSMAFKYSLELPQLAEQLDNCVRQFISKGYRPKDLTDDDNFIYTNKVASKSLDILDEFEND